MADNERVLVGMRVVGSDGQDVGIVTEIRRTDFRVGRDLLHDIYVPSAIVQEVHGRVKLTCPAAEVHNESWDCPDADIDRIATGAHDTRIRPAPRSTPPGV
ncbi:MAG: DUF2171 domain-containing protein [Chloroflexi bacterium]|nr:DUF2171 domain-containing protein [Chloroflexota bacterium]